MKPTTQTDTVAGDELNHSPEGLGLGESPCSAGLYQCECDDPRAVAPRGVVAVIADERGFPTILIDEGKRWPLHMLPPGCRLIPLPNAEATASQPGAGPELEK